MAKNEKDEQGADQIQPAQGFAERPAEETNAPTVAVGDGSAPVKDKDASPALKNAIKGGKYRVEHTAVGSHIRGQVVTKEHFLEGTDMDRLVRLGAVSVAEDDAAVTPLGGEEPVFVPTPFATPYSATVVSPDPLRSENPPTLPRPGFPMQATPIED